MLDAQCALSFWKHGLEYWDIFYYSINALLLLLLFFHFLVLFLKVAFT